MTTNPITSTAAVATTRAPRYGKQLVSHLGRRSIGVWDEDTASGRLDMSADTNEGAHVAFSCTAAALLIQISAADADVATYEDVVGRHLVRFGERDELQVDWQRADGSDGTTQS